MGVGSGPPPVPAAQRSAGRGLTARRVLLERMAEGRGGGLAPRAPPAGLVPAPQRRPATIGVHVTYVLSSKGADVGPLRPAGGRLPAAPPCPPRPPHPPPTARRRPPTLTLAACVRASVIRPHPPPSPPPPPPLRPSHFPSTVSDPPPAHPPPPPFWLPPRIDIPPLPQRSACSGRGLASPAPQFPLTRACGAPHPPPAPRPPPPPSA